MLSTTYTPSGSGPQSDNLTIVSNSANGSFSVLLAGMAGAGVPAVVLPSYPVLTSKFLRLYTDDSPYAVTTADFNGDGRMDIAAVSSTFSVVSVFIAEGDGIFRNYKDRVNYTTGGDPRSIQSADFNGDGKRDLVVANRSSNTVSILLSNGDGTFAPRIDAAVGTNPRWSLSAISMLTARVTWL